MNAEARAEPALANFDPFDPAVMRCPHAAWAMLRREAPVFRMNLPNVPVPVFMVTRRKEIEQIVRDPALFSNHPEPTIWRWGEFEPEIQQAFDKCGRKVVYTLATSDPPEASEYRRIADKRLNRNEVLAMQPEIERLVDTLIDAMPSGAAFNFVEAFSVPLPLLLICRILGVPYDDTGFIRFFSDEFAHLVDPAYSTARAAQAADTVAEGYLYFERHLDRYRAHPADNLLSEIANGTIHGRPVSVEEALSMAHNLVIAGNETTRNALSSALFTLARQPDLWRRLREDPARIAEFVEELLRLEAPALTTPRQVMADTEINGIPIPKGSSLFLMWGSASTDESVFPDPLTLDIERRNKRMHYTFGLGLHTCVGNHLARAEINTAIARWLHHFESVELAKPASEIGYMPIFGFRAMDDLPVIVRRRSPSA